MKVVITEEKEKEFRDLSKPLIDWLLKNYHPHTKIIIETDSAEIVEGLYCHKIYNGS